MALRKAGLTVVKHKTMDGEKMMLKVSAPEALLVKEAERTEVRTPHHTPTDLSVPM